jgi:hypothetical protein
MFSTAMQDQCGGGEVEGRESVNAGKFSLDSSDPQFTSQPTSWPPYDLLPI